MSYDFEAWTSAALQRIASGLNLVEPSPSQSLFKFISLGTQRSWQLLESTLETRTLEGSPPENLNDPFEISPAVFNDLNGVQVLENSSSKRVIDKQGLRTESLDYESGRALALASLDQMKKRCRVISFSERYDSPLLWAHYANSYKGACLHFLGGKMQKVFTYNLAQVQYRTERPIYPLSLALYLEAKRPKSPHHAVDPMYDQARAESDRMLYFTKAKDWDYEREVRKVYDSSVQKRMSFDPDSLVSIICGPKMTSADRHRLQELVSASPMSGIPILDAKVSSSSFSIAVDWSTTL